LSDSVFRVTTFGAVGIGVEQRFSSALTGPN
jgi:hypothetical protein